jgi:hypothetical protein
MQPTATADDPALESFLEGYLECAIWSSTDPDTNGEPLDSRGWELSCLDPAARDRAETDCRAFLAAAYQAVDPATPGLPDASRMGHDFWLTRNGHGAGFWDGDYPEPAGDVLTEIAETFGEIDLYPGDDDTLYFS